MRNTRRHGVTLLIAVAAALCLLGQVVAVAAADDSPAAADASEAKGPGAPLITPKEAPTTDVPGPAPSSLQPRSAGWNVLMSENFEGVFPNGLWTAYDADGATNGEYFWDDDDWMAHTGSWGAWPANGGINGLDPASWFYPNYMDSWMVYGPFDLSNPAYNSADFEFWYWNESESCCDFFSWLASGDGASWATISSVSGISGGGGVGAWQWVDADLSGYLGDSSVWIAFRFTSDLSIVDDGPVVDDVILWAYDLSPANDDFDSATVIPGATYTTTQSTAFATTAGDDPTFTCVVGQKYQTVWYAYTPSVSQHLDIDTFGSDYDTVLGVWTGSRGSLSPVACSDDYNGYQSAVELFADPGVTYYIEAASYANTAGSLTLNFAAADIVEAIFYGGGANDGWVLESEEDSSKGSDTRDWTATTARLGDDSADRQYRSIVDFDTSSLPDTAVVVAVTLQIKRQSISGTNPFTTHGLLKVDIKAGYYHDNPALERFDFHAVGSRGNVGRFIKTPSAGWYRAPLRESANPFIHLAGHTQFRLRFDVDDNDDLGDDYLSFFTGNAVSLTDRPVLDVIYYVP